MDSFNKLALAAGISAALALSCAWEEVDECRVYNKCGSSSSMGGSSSSFAYKIVKIGAQTWMAENLSDKAGGGKCYGEGGDVVVLEDESIEELSEEEVQANCAKYGRLYAWEAAKTACPSGWRLPSNADWDALFKYVDSDYDAAIGASLIAGKHLKAESGWNSDGQYGKVSNGNGDDKHGFAAMPGGLGHPNGYFGAAGTVGGWWSASEHSADSAYHREMVYSEDYAGKGKVEKAVFLSVRCLKN